MKRSDTHEVQCPAHGNDWEIVAVTVNGLIDYLGIIYKGCDEKGLALAT